MTWNALTNLATGQLVLETHMDQIRENIEHVGAMLAGANTISALTAGAQLLFVSGTYTGNGAATQAITGVGFQPRFVLIYSRDTNLRWSMKTYADGVGAFRPNGSGAGYRADELISLDANGFTVGDGTDAGVNTLNVNTLPYTYIAFR